MPIMEWKPEFSVGVEAFDEQHKVLINLINDLHDGMAERKGAQVLGPILEELTRYTVTHFVNEERVFEKTAYPETAIHASIHRKMTAQVKDLQTRFASGQLMLSIETFNFLKQWLQNHILETDKKYSAHLKDYIVK